MPPSFTLIVTIGLALIALAIYHTSKIQMKWVGVIACLLLFFVATSYIILPLLIDTISRGQVRSKSISPLSAREVEWRSRDHENSVVPTLRIERARWAWGGIKDAETGLLVFRIQGVSYRVRKGNKKEPQIKVQKPRQTGNFSVWLISKLVNLFVHHYSSLARLVSIEIRDIRFIFDDLDGLELTVQTFRLGMQIEFDNVTDVSTSGINPMLGPFAKPMSPLSSFSSVTIGDKRHEFPFNANTFSPPDSPSVATSLTHISMGGSTDDDDRPSRFRNARRRASVFQSRMSNTATQVFSRAIARARGSVSVSALVADVAIILPHSNPPIPMSSKPSMAEVSGTASSNSGVKIKPSLSSLKSGKSILRTPSGKSFKSKPYQKRSNYALPNDEGGYEQLLVIKGKSTAMFALGFGPRKGLLGENTLRTSLDLGTLHACLGAVDKVQQLVKARKASTPIEPRESKDSWAPTSLPRVILRAFETVSVSCTRVVVSHFLPAPNSQPPSASSSVSDFSMISSTDQEFFTLSIDVSELGCQLSAADSSNNIRARNAFGTNTSPQSKVRGIGASVSWQSVALHCIAPNEDANVKSQLISIRQAECDAFSSWRPAGWTRDEILFDTDPNLSLVVVSCTVASLGLAADVQLLDELNQAFKQNQTVQSPFQSMNEENHVDPKPREPIQLPRFRTFFELGHISVVIADRLPKQKTTLTLASDGMSLGWYTSYSDICGRRQPGAARSAFKDEADLQARRQASEELGDNIDYSQPDAMLKPQYRRKFDNPAKMLDDYLISMRGDVVAAIEPTTLHMTLSGEKVRDQTTFSLASIGKVLFNVNGDIRGRVKSDDDGRDTIILDPKSLSTSVGVGIDDGIKVNLWDIRVVDALIAMSHARQSSGPPLARVPKSFEQENILDRLPSGISAHVCLGTVSVFLGGADPNPNCQLKLVRGLWLQTTPSFEYAYYRYKSQGLRCRHALDQPSRKKLRLRDDITTQALAFANFLGPYEGTAALFSLCVIDTMIKPIFNGDRFSKSGGVDLIYRFSQDDQPAEPVRDDYIAWEFQKRNNKPQQGTFANNVPPLDIEDAEQAQRPLIRIPHLLVNHVVQQSRPTEELIHKLTARIEQIRMVADMSHVWCALLAVHAAKSIIDAWKRPNSKSTPGPQPNSKINLSIDMVVPHAYVHFAFPLKEQAFISLNHVTVSQLPQRSPLIRSSCVLLHVPSPSHVGAWEELGRIRGLQVTLPKFGEPLTFDVHATALRICIPHSYVLSKLILNVNTFVKSTKLLLGNLRTGDFHSVKEPEAEDPKRVPSISIRVETLHLEAKDHPVETNMNLAWRVGLEEQENRNQREDAFDQKMQILAETHPDLSIVGEDTGRALPDMNDTQLTDKYSITPFEARARLDWYNSVAWIRRIKRAKTERKRREKVANRPFETAIQFQLPISVVKLDDSVPIFRASFRGVRFKVQNPELSRQEIIEYMSGVSSPFGKEAEFSLMVPLDLDWSMNQATIQLRDYPLPLVRVQPVADGSAPAWNVKTLFIVAEELAGPDSNVYIPAEIVPANCGAPDAQPFTLQIAKTIMPVKTYARPHVKIASEKTTEFTWGNSYQPAVHDFVRVIETLSNPPRDPSSKVGFWDKFRLVLHWRVLIEFAGSFDPYSITGHGAGFALSWQRNARVEIAQPNAQYETIQIMSEEMLIAIPDLAALKDGAAIGNNPDPIPVPSHRPIDEHVSDQELIERRSTKPCARFLNGVRVGFGFQFERTCRPSSCDNCGSTDNLMHRQCRIFKFKRHQEVILRSPEGVKKREEELGHVADSYEEFRSDYIHFSVSLVAGPKTPQSGEQDLDAVNHNSLHFSPKAFAHFFAWWNLPIRQGKAFPDSGPPSKKFGRSIGTIKYRFNLAPIYVSHFYSQVSKDLWDAGKAQSLGLKARFGHFRADAHQRAQEKVVKHEKLQRTTTVVHKPFYAADLQLHDIRVKGICANFNEMHRQNVPTTDEEGVPRVSELPPDLKQWYNFFDFIDADRKPFDRDPRVEMVDFGDCPHVFFSKRVKARQTTPQDDETSMVNSDPDGRIDIESSKFGHEKTHICYLGAARGVGPMQADITQERIKELEESLASLSEVDQSTIDTDTSDIPAQRKIFQHRLAILRKHLDDLSATERRHIDDDTLQAHGTPHHPAVLVVNKQGEATFENTFHVHCPRVFFNNASRNIVYKYWFSSQDRKREEYTTSHASLRGIRDGINRRARRTPNGLNRDDLDAQHIPNNTAASIQAELERTVTNQAGGSQFKLPPDVSNDEEDLRRPSQGLPVECVVKPKNRILILKPQIALRSEADPSAIVLLAVEEISFKGFAVLDEQGFDQITADVMTRNYVTLKGLQAFSPNREILNRGMGSRGVPRGLDFVPLEIFLDVRSEAIDYDRIVLKTDAAVSFDKFNELRMPRGLEWPDVTDENGLVLRHLRIHEDLTTVIVPRVTVSATSKHYASLYYVVTDLLVYQDPAHLARSKRIESFMLTFDRKDRNPQKLLTDLFALQQSIRSLSQLQLGYENNLDLLNDTGKSELFKIRTDLLNATEELFVVFEAISVGQAKDDARAALKSLSRLDVRAGGVAWHMLQDDFKPLAKFDIERTAFSFVSNKDGTSDSAIAIGELAALNSNADALFPEVLVRYEAKRRAEPRPAFATACWSLMPAVGGIDIVRELNFVIQPVRVKLESQVGSAIKAYIWGQEEKTKKGERKANGDHPATATKHHDIVTPLSRSKSQMSISSSTISGRSRAGTGMSTAEPPPIKHEHKFVIVSDRDVVEMRRRASTNRTFIKVYLAAAFIVLDWRGEGWIPDCTDFKLRTPELTYTNQIWSFSDMFDHVKRDVKAAGWQQTGDIVSQFLKKTTWLRDRQRRRESPGYRHDMLTHKNPKSSSSSQTHHINTSILRSSNPSSHLKTSMTASSPSPTPSGVASPLPVNVQPPTPLENEVMTLSRNESLPSIRSERSARSEQSNGSSATTATTNTASTGGGLTVGGAGGVGLGISHGPLMEEDEDTSAYGGSVMNGLSHGKGEEGKTWNRNGTLNENKSMSSLGSSSEGKEDKNTSGNMGSVMGKAVKDLFGKIKEWPNEQSG